MATRKSLASANRQAADGDYKRAIVEEVGKSIRTLGIAGAVVAVAYLIGHALEAMAGKETDANIIISMLGKVEASIVLSWVVGVGGVVYGRAQKKLRRSTVERLQGRINELEKQIDPRRSSSRLTARGETNPEDA